jgi:hypothetical protein
MGADPRPGDVVIAPQPGARPCEFCALAESRPEYAGDHRNCRGSQTVRLPGSKPGEAPLFSTVCSCSCGESGRTEK